MNLKELEVFKNSLVDRFGELPNQVEKLLKLVELKWICKKIGFEKLVVKNGKMIGYFIKNEKSAYYQSPVFTSVLNYVQARSFGVEMSEKNNKLRLIYSDVHNIDKAIAVLSPITSVTQQVKT